MWHAVVMLAQEAPKNNAPPLFDLLPFLVIPLLFILVVWQPAKRQEERARKSLLDGLKKNDKVLTTGGIYGTVVSVSDKENEVIVRVDDNCRLKMVKESIARNLSNEEAARATKAAATGAKA